MDLTAGTHTYEVPSASIEGRKHTVRCHRDGHWSCTCQDFYWRKGPRGKICRHITAVQAEICLDQLRRWSRQAAMVEGACPSCRGWTRVAASTGYQPLCPRCSGVLILGRAAKRPGEGAA